MVDNHLCIDGRVAFSTVPALKIVRAFNLKKTAVNKEAAIGKTADIFKFIYDMLPFSARFRTLHETRAQTSDDDRCNLFSIPDCRCLAHSKHFSCIKYRFY